MNSKSRYIEKFLLRIREPLYRRGFSSTSVEQVCNCFKQLLLQNEKIEVCIKKIEDIEDNTHWVVEMERFAGKLISATLLYEYDCNSFQIFNGEYYFVLSDIDFEKTVDHILSESSFGNIRAKIDFFPSNDLFEI
jgi:hypothetical protein